MPGKGHRGVGTAIRVRPAVYARAETFDGALRRIREIKTAIGTDKRYGPHPQKVYGSRTQKITLPHVSIQDDKEPT